MPFPLYFSVMLLVVLLAAAAWHAHAEVKLPSTIAPSWISEHAEQLRAEMKSHRFGFIVGSQHSGLFALLLHSPCFL